ncbi:MAG TPA: hypothetical protein VK705_09850 [Ferruginibacter sp.]|jgi:hypothetical protein|nr:hypothetical protein [Ferruginibacter sp.]
MASNENTGTVSVGNTESLGVGDDDNTASSSHLASDIAGLAGGIVETTIGLGSEEFTLGASTVFVADGVDRTATNFHNVIADLYPDLGQSRITNTSIGSQIGSNFGPDGQQVGQIIGDVTIIAVTGGPISDLASMSENLISNPPLAGVYLYSIIDAYKTITEDSKK